MTARGCLILVAACLCAATSAAAQAPAARTPVGPPGRVMDMLPSHTTMAPRGGQDTSAGAAGVAADRVRVQNVGNQALGLSYFDGQAWQNITVGAGQTLDVPCARCGATIHLAYHNGREVKRVEAAAGNSYVLSWSSRDSAWELTSRA